MTEEEIIHTALINLEKGTQIKGKWQKNGQKALDGQLTLRINNEQFKFNLEIKTELRSHMIPQILEYKQKYPPFMLGAGRLFPKMKEELRENNVPYIEANGNFFFRQDKLWFCIDVNPPLELEQDNRNRAFTKTGLKVLFEFLQDPNLIHQTYRHIAEYTKTAVGNVTNIIGGLKQEGFIEQLNKNTIQLAKKETLIAKWVEAYEYNLKPTLKMGTFRFVNDADNLNWNNIKLKEGKTWWGGEPAGDILTHYLRPEELTLYTEETRNELIKNYKLVPDEQGQVKIYKNFWINTNRHLNTKAVPPLLAYADLMNTNDKRCRETAQKIYDEFIQPDL
jgi:hypothetical protein